MLTVRVRWQCTRSTAQTARKYLDWHRDKFGYERGNVEFKQGYIERLGDVGIPDNSIDVIVSNCVVNLRYICALGRLVGGEGKGQHD